MASPVRRIVSSANFLVTLALLGVLFILVNFTASRRYARWELTAVKISALSDQTIQTLASLKEPVSVIVFYQPASGLYELIRDVLEAYAHRTDKLKIEYVDPEQDIARARQLVKQFDIDVKDPSSLNLVIFASGARNKRLSDPDLAEFDYTGAMGGEPHVKSFKGEDAFTSAIISVTRGTKPLAWFTSGHGEKPLEDKDRLGLSDLGQALAQQDIRAETVTLLERTEIPAEVKLVVVAGPAKRFTEPELQLLQAYLEQGGKLLLLLDPMDDSGLPEWLAHWGITVGNDIVVDPSRRLPLVSAANLFVTEYTLHPIVQKMKTLATLFPLARSVRPAQPAPEGVTATPLAVTSADGWGETQTTVQQFEYNEAQDLKGPVSIAVAAERKIPAKGETPEASARIVVAGDSEFVVNAQLGNLANRDFLLGAVYWLIEEEHLIGIGPKPLNSIKLNLTSRQMTGLFWFSFLAMPLLCGLLGAAMWWWRRT